MDITEILKDHGIDKMDTWCVRGLTMEQTINRIAKLRSYVTKIQQLKDSTKLQVDQIGHQRIFLEISEAKAAIAWHEDVLKNYTDYPYWLRRASDLGNRFKDRRFENIDQKSIDKSALDACMYFAESFNDLKSKQKNGLILSGDVGIGKTLLAASIANYLIDVRHTPVFFGNIVGFLGNIKDEFGEEDFTKATMKSVPLLIIDDLGKEKITEWVNQTLYEIIDYRYEHRLPIVVTTNLSENELRSRLDKSVASRLLGMCNWLDMNGKDMRN